MHLFFICVLGILVCGKAEEELVAVSLLYRHGDRTPMFFYPTDPYKDPSIWPVPLGELTNDGKLQHYELGKWLRNRYNGFLSPLYNKSEIYIRSSDADRCLMSAASNLAGLYPPQEKDIWTQDLLWQPIPIHTIPRKQDDIAEVRTSCTKYEGLKNEAENMPYFKQINEENAELYAYVSANSGEEITTFVNASDIYDTLHIEKIHNLSLPNWTLPVYPKLKTLNDISPELFTSTPELTRLFTGRFFHNVASQFSYLSKEKLDDQENYSYEKFRVFSAHDDQVFSLLNALQVQNLENPPFAATVLFELWKSEESGFYVQVLYKTKTNFADLVQIHGCELKCDFDNFVKIIEPIVLTKEEFEKECN